MNKQDALKELFQVENRLKELRKMIEQPEDIMSRVTTVEEAKEVLGIKDDWVPTNKQIKKASAFENLCIVIKALNEGWVPDFENVNELKYYNIFNMNSGFSYCRTDCCYTVTFVPTALLFKSEKLAKYCFDQFTQLYKDLYL